MSYENPLLTTNADQIMCQKVLTVKADWTVWQELGQYFPSFTVR